MRTISPNSKIKAAVLIAAALILFQTRLALAVVASGSLSASNGSLSLESNTSGFLSNSAALSCSTTGNLIVDLTANTLAWCKDTTEYHTALGDDSGNALSGDSATAFFSSGVLESSIGGTGSAFTEFTGPATTKKTFTLPDASATICTTNSTCSGYQAALSGGDVTTSSGGASATIGNDKITEAMLKSVNTPTDEYCLTYESTIGDFEWQSCAIGGSGITGITGDTGGTTTGSTVTLAGGTGITTTRATDTVTISAASNEAGFLTSGALTCGASTAGKAQVHTTPLQYCDNAATPTLRYTAYGDSSGVASIATALNANGANCTGNNFALGVDASGVSECAQPGFSNLSGNATAVQGGTGVTSYVANTMYYAPAATPSALSAVPTPTPTAAPFYLTYNGAASAPSWSKVNMATGVTGTLGAGNGGTGNLYSEFTVTGASSKKVFTLPNADSTVFTNNTTTMTVASGGTLNAASGGSVVATSLDSGGTGTDGSRIITMPDNVSATPSPPAANKTNIHTRSGIGYIQPSHVASGWGYQIQASQVALGSSSTQALTSTTLTDLTSISFSLKSGKKYWIQGSLSATPSVATADPQFAVNFSTTAGTPIIAVRGTCTFNAGTGAITSFVLTANNTAGICTIGVANDITAMLDGYVSPGTSDATLTVRASPNGTGTLTIAAYPLFRVTEFQ